MADILSIGVSGLKASQSAISTAGNNISNANTPGYSRQRVELTPQPSQYMGAGYIGSGVQVASIERTVDQLYIGQLRADTATFHELDSYTTQISQLDSLLADQSTGLSPSLQSFFSDLQQASQDPTSVPVRQVVLSDAGSLVQRFSTLYEGLQSLSQSVQQKFYSLTSQATNLAQSIAKLNQDILNQGGADAQPNSLLDQREELIRQLSEVVGVNAVQQTDGMVNVFMGNGQPLVIGSRANKLSTTSSLIDPTQQVITLDAGSAVLDITQYATGGNLGGVVKFQNGTLNNAYNSLGRIAITFADAMNTQHKKGVDLNGQAGTNLFTDINSASAMSSRALPAPTNSVQNQPNVFINNASALTTSDYKLSFTTAGYALTRLSDNATVASGAPLPAGPAVITTSDGFQIQIATPPAAGDSFLIQPTRIGAQNIAVSLQAPDELALAQPMRTNAVVSNTGGGAISQGLMVSQYPDPSAPIPTQFSLPNPATPLTTPLLIQFTSAASYQILNNSSPPAVAFAPPLTGTFKVGQNNVIEIDGAPGVPAYQFTLSGNPASGDQFTVASNSSGISDNRNALALAGLSLAKTVRVSSVSLSGMTFADSYGKMVSDIGSTTASLKNSRDAANTLLTQSQANRDSVSAVNLDEEAANLIKFQQAYSASAQVITIARTLFTTLLGAFQ